MLVINPEKRWGAKKVFWRLRGIMDQKTNPKSYYCSDRPRNTFNPSPLLRPWDEASYDQQLLFHLNAKTARLAYSGLTSGVGFDMSSLPDTIKHDMELYDFAFVSQSSDSTEGPSRSPTSTTMGTDAAPGGQIHTISEASSVAHDQSSRDASVDLTRASSQDAPQQRQSLELTSPTSQLFGNLSNAGSIQVSTDFTQQDASQDAQFLRTPSKSHAPSSRAASIFTQGLRRSMSTRTGQSTLGPGELSEEIQSTVTGPGTDTKRGGAAGGSLQGPERGGSSCKAEIAQRGSSPKRRLSVLRAWRSLRKTLRAVTTRGRQSLGHET